MTNLWEEINFDEELKKEADLRAFLETAAEEYSAKFDYAKFKKPEKINEIDRFLLVSGFPPSATT
jgi:hypothetical protein